jgi:glycosyltransferase involved in cell wall biosynthesis
MNVFMIPKNHEYIRRLKASLEALDVRIEILKPFHYSSFVNLAKLLYYRGRGFRVIHVHWLYIFPFGFVMKGFYYLCRALGVRVVWEMHNILPHNSREKDRRHSRWFYERSDAIIFHSESDVARAKEQLLTDVDKTHIVIPHGNFNESYPNCVSKADARSSLGIARGTRVILCFGFLRRNRGYEYLLDAVKDMADTVVLIAGEMMEKDVYDMLVERARAMPNLRLFVKWIADDELQLYFNACDIVVLPYTAITTSGVIPLSYAFSRPVITTSIGGIKDVVNENTGILVPPRDAEALSAAIERIFGMDYEGMGRYANEFSMREFSWESNARKIRELYGAIA